MAKVNAAQIGEKVIAAARECGMTPEKLLELVVASVADPDARAGLSAAANPAALSNRPAAKPAAKKPAPAPSAKKLATEIEATAKRLDAIGKALASKPKAQPVGKPVKVVDPVRQDPHTRALDDSLRHVYASAAERTRAIVRIMAKAAEIERGARGKK